jgi:hypothetical protein
LDKQPSLGYDHSKKTYLEALSWMQRQAEDLTEVCLAAPHRVQTDSPGGITDNFDKGLVRKMARDYESAFAHAPFLDILTDYLPGYMAHCSGSQADDGFDPKRFILFFQDLENLLPLLKTHCRHAIEMLQENRTLAL